MSMEVDGRFLVDLGELLILFFICKTFENGSTIDGSGVLERRLVHELKHADEQNQNHQEVATNDQEGVEFATLDGRVLDLQVFPDQV